MSRFAVRRVLLVCLLAALLGAAAGALWQWGAHSGRGAFPARAATGQGAAARAKSLASGGVARVWGNDQIASGDVGATSAGSATSATVGVASGGGPGAALSGPGARPRAAGRAPLGALRTVVRGGAVAASSRAKAAPSDARKLGTGAAAVGESAEATPEPAPTPTPDDSYGTIFGFVIRSDGSPTSGALVSVALAEGELANAPVGQIVSGPSGDFAFAGLSPKTRYYLRAHSEGYGDAEARGVLPAPGGGTQVELVLGGTGRLAGTVVSTDEGVALPGVVVRLGGTAGGLRYTTTDDSGQFAFGNLPTGVYQLAGRADTAGVTVWVCEPLEGLAVKTGATLPVRMRAWPPSRVQGSVLDRARNAGVAGAEVQLVRFRPASGAWGGQSDAGCGGKVTTDGDGQFAIQGLLAGEYRVYLRHSQYPVPATPDWLTLAEGDAQEGLQYFLDSGGGLTGTVIDGSGRVVPKVTVHVEARPDPFYEMPPAQPNQVTGADGRFVFQGLRFDREYRVTTAFDTGSDGKPRPFAASDYCLLTAEEPSADVVLNLAAGLAVRGRVSDADGRAVGTAVVTVRGPAGSGPWKSGIWGSAVTDGNGVYGLAGLAPGDYTVTVVRTGYLQSEARKVSLAIGDAEGVDFVLQRGLGLRGLLVDLGAQRLPGWQVTALGPDPANPSGPAQPVGVGVTSGGDGSFRLDGLGDTAVLQISRGTASGLMVFRSGEVTPSADGGETVFVVPAGGALTAKVVDGATGAAIDDFSIDLHLDSAAAASSASGAQCVAVQADLTALSGTGQGGLFATPPLAAGKYRLHVWAAGHVARDLTDVLVPAEGRDLGQIALAPGASLVGRLVETATGLPYVPDNTDYGPSHFFAVVAEGAGGESPGLLQGEIEADGTFSVSGMPAAVRHAYLKVGARLPVELDNLPAADDQGIVRAGDVRLEAGCTVRGHVRAPNGTPLGRVQVLVSCPGHDLPDAIRRTVPWRTPDSYYASGLTRDDGSYEVRGAFAGPVTVFAVTSPARYSWAAGHGDPYKSLEVSATASARTPAVVEIRFR